MSIFHNGVFKFKWLLIAASLLFIGYCQAYYWTALPDEFGITWRWQPDNAVEIVSVSERNAQLLSSGDLILKIDGRQLIHTHPVFKPPIKDTYSLTVQRESELHLIKLELPDASASPIMLSILVGLISCLAGSAILFTARMTDKDGLQLGAIFLFLGLSFSGMTAAQQGVPGAWLVGHVALSYCPMALIGLGWLPKPANYGRWFRPIFYTLFAFCSVIAVLAFIEAVWLFPAQKSWQTYSGISLIRSLYLSIAIALLLFISTVTLRSITTTQSYLKQQLRILSFFLAFAILPAVFLTILPSMLFNIILMPKMISFGLIGMGPIGYLYVANRRSSPSIDHWAGRSILLLLLAMVAFILYAAITQLPFLKQQGILDYRLQALLLSVTLLAVFFIKSPLERAVDWLIAGPQVFDREELVQLSHALSRNPESITLQRWVERIAERFNIDASLLLLEEDLRKTKMVFKTGEAAEIVIPTRYMPFTKPQFIQSGSSLFSQMPWATLILPLHFAGKQIGYYAFAAPRNDRFFSGRQIDTLIEFAATIATGSQAVFLFESVDALAAKTKLVRVDERAQLSKRLHSQPIQSLLAVKQMLELSSQPENKLIEKAVINLQQVTDELRTISQNLRDSVIDKQLETIVYAIVKKFEALESSAFVYVFAKHIQAFTPDASVAFAVHEVLGEAFSNIYRHAQATKVWLTVERHRQNLTVTISDNGIGLAQPLNISDLTRQGVNMGIVDMHSSVRAAGGKLLFEKNEHGGLTVHCTLPLQGVIVI